MNDQPNPLVILDDSIALVVLIAVVLAFALGG